MQLTDDQYLIKWGDKTKVMSRTASRDRLKAGREKKDRDDPGWRTRCHRSAEWSPENRQEQSAKMKALWNSPEYADQRAAAAARLKAANIPPMTDKTREAHRDRMLMGGARKALAGRKIMSQEAIEERESRNAQIVRNYYGGKMKATEIAKLYKLDISHVYKIIRTVEFE